jgi:signal transduction histidine kinase
MAELISHPTACRHRSAGEWLADCLRALSSCRTTAELLDALRAALGDCGWHADWLEARTDAVPSISAGNPEPVVHVPVPREPPYIGWLAISWPAGAPAPEQRALEALADALAVLWEMRRREQEESRRQAHRDILAELYAALYTSGHAVTALAMTVEELLGRDPLLERVVCGIVQGEELYLPAWEARGWPGRYPVPAWLWPALEADGDVVELPRTAGLAGEPLSLKGPAIAVTVRPPDPTCPARGVIWLERRDTAPWDEESKRFLKAAAFSIRMSVQNWQLFQGLDHELDSHLRQLKAVVQIGQIVTASLEMDEILQRVLGCAVEFLHAERGVIVGVDLGAGVMTIREVLGPHRADYLGQTRPLAGTLSEWVARRREVVCIPDTTVSGWYDPYIAGWLTGSPPRSILALPLQRGEQVIGVLFCLDKKEGTFGPEDIELAQAVSDWAAIALENAELYASVRSTEEGWRRVAVGLGSAIAWEQSEESIYKTVMDLSLEALGVDACAVEILSADGETLECRASRNLPPPLEPRCAPVKLCISGKALLRNEPVLIHDIPSDERLYRRQNARISPYRSALCVPLRTDSGAFGVFTVYRRPAAAFDAQDIQLVTAFADHMAAGIERVRLLEGRRQQSLYLRSLLDNISEVIFILNAEGQVELANRAGRELSRISRFPGMRHVRETAPAYFPSPPEDQPPDPFPFAPIILARARAGDQGPFVLEVDTGAGRPAHLMVRVFPLEAGRRYLVIGRDTSRQQYLERWRYEALRNLHHELRTPLAGVLGFVQYLLMTSGVPQATWEHCLQSAREQALRLQNLLDDLHMYNTLPLWGVQAPFACTEVWGVIQMVIQLIQRRYGGRVAFCLEGERSVPKVVFDSKLLQRVLWHLVDNAVKFSPADQPVTIRVEVLRDAFGDWVEVQVRDRGIGISPAELERLFDPFHQADDRVERRYAGLGLGLTLVRRAVEGAGGYIRVESRLGEGSCFAIRLPVCPPQCGQSK